MRPTIIILTTNLNLSVLQCILRSSRDTLMDMHTLPRRTLIRGISTHPTITNEILYYDMLQFFVLSKIMCVRKITFFTATYYYYYVNKLFQIIFFLYITYTLCTVQLSCLHYPAHSCISLPQQLTLPQQASLYPNDVIITRAYILEKRLLLKRIMHFLRNVVKYEISLSSFLQQRIPAFLHNPDRPRVIISFACKSWSGFYYSYWLSLCNHVTLKCFLTTAQSPHHVWHDPWCCTIHSVIIHCSLIIVIPDFAFVQCWKRSPKGGS